MHVGHRGNPRPHERQPGEVLQLSLRLLFERHAVHPTLDRDTAAFGVQQLIVLFTHTSFLERTAPPSPSGSDGLLRFQAHHLVQDAIQAAEHGELVDLFGDLLQGLQLLQAHQHWAALDQLGSVEQRTRGVRLLAATDHVGLRRLLRLYHAIEDVLHLARQNHVLYADTQHFQTQLGHATTHIREDIRIQRGLVAKQFVQRLGRYRLAQAVLQLAVEVVEILRYPRTRCDRIDHTQAGRQVHAQADLVARQQLLTGHLQRLHAQVNHLGSDILAEVPECVGTRREYVLQLAVDKQQTCRFLWHLDHDGNLAQGAQLTQAVGHVGANVQALGHRHRFDRYRHQRLPVQLARTRCENVFELAMLEHEADFVSTDIRGQERIGKQAARHQGLGIRTHVLGTCHVVGHHLDPLERIEKAVHTG